MRARLVAGLVLAILWTTACGPSAPAAPAASGAAPAASGGAAAAAPGGADATAGGAAAAAPSWDSTVAAAKREGRLSIMGPQGNETRDALTLGFQQQYPDIQIDYQGIA